MFNFIPNCVSSTFRTIYETAQQTSERLEAMVYNCARNTLLGSAAEIRGNWNYNPSLSSTPVTVLAPPAREVPLTPHFDVAPTPVRAAAWTPEEYDYQEALRMINESFNVGRRVDVLLALGAISTKEGRHDCVQKASLLITDSMDSELKAHVFLTLAPLSINDRAILMQQTHAIMTESGMEENTLVPNEKLNLFFALASIPTAEEREVILQQMRILVPRPMLWQNYTAASIIRTLARLTTNEDRVDAIEQTRRIVAKCSWLPLPKKLDLLERMADCEMALRKDYADMLSPLINERTDQFALQSLMNQIREIFPYRDDISRSADFFSLGNRYTHIVMGEFELLFEEFPGFRPYRANSPLCKR